MLSEKSKKSLLTLLGAAHSLNHSLFLIAPPLLLTIMVDLGTSKFLLGVAGTLSSLIYGVGSLVGGPLSDRVGEIKVITLCMALSGAFTFTILLAQEIVVYSLGLFLIAAWASLYHPTANSLISKVFPRGMAEAMGLHGVGGTLGVMLTPVVAVFLGKTFGWRFSFLFFGVLCIVFAVLLTKYSFKTVQTVSEGKIWDVFRFPGLWKIFLFNSVIGLYMKGVEYFFPTYLVLKPFQGFDINYAKMLAAMAWTLVLAAGVVGQWLGGKTADYFGSKKVLIVTSVGVLLSLVFLQFTPVPVVGIMAFIYLYGIGFYGHQPALNSLAGLKIPNDKKGMIYGVLFFTSFGLGSLSQSIVGFCADTFGIETSFYPLTAFSVAALLLSFLLPDWREPSTKENPP